MQLLWSDSFITMSCIPSVNNEEEQWGFFSTLGTTASPRLSPPSILFLHPLSRRKILALVITILLPRALSNKKGSELILKMILLIYFRNKEILQNKLNTCFIHTSIWPKFIPYLTDPCYLSITAESSPCFRSSWLALYLHIVIEHPELEETH